MQREIYDLRYSGDGYDTRSAIPVLTAERGLLLRATEYATERIPGPLTLLDFGYGTGRVTNEFIRQYIGDLRVVAYDVSMTGLLKGARHLQDHGFVLASSFAAGFDLYGQYLCELSRAGVSVSFFHGQESDDPAHVSQLLQSAVRGTFGVVSSWYSALTHIPGAYRRAAFFDMLADLTHPAGELVVTASALGDLVAAQAYWRECLQAGLRVPPEIQGPGDVMYETELGQQNFAHVFGEDLGDMVSANSTLARPGWLEAVRMPDQEFQTVDQELSNWRRVQEFNRRMHGRGWLSSDYRQVHTVAAILSAR